MKRSLALRKETLTELATGDLAGVVGAGTRGCISYTRTPTGCTCGGGLISLDADCPTLVDCKL